MLLELLRYRCRYLNYKACGHRMDLTFGYGHLDSFKFPAVLLSSANKRFIQNTPLGKDDYTMQLKYLSFLQCVLFFIKQKKVFANLKTLNLI